MNSLSIFSIFLLVSCILVIQANEIRDENCADTCVNLPNVMSSHCEEEMCIIDECSSNFCDSDLLSSNGCESDYSSPTSCGSCSNNCLSKPNVVDAECVDSTCVIVQCATGFSDCNGFAFDGCETGTTTNPRHCGSCFHECSPLPDHAGTATCSNSMCVIPTCEYNYLDCDKQFENGCETNKTSVNSCGACGNICTGKPHVSSVDCIDMKCKILQCDDNFADCNKLPSDGCEFNLNINVKNCGSCGHVCSLPHVVTNTCSNGLCTIGKCAAGFHSCDGINSNGCERRTDNDPLNCGSCGNICSLPHAISGCSASKCIVSSCESGWCNKNGQAYDGCETKC